MQLILLIPRFHQFGMSLLFWLQQTEKQHNLLMNQLLNNKKIAWLVSFPLLLRFWDIYSKLARFLVDFRQTGVTITKFPITITITSKMSGFFERKITLNDRQNEWDCLSFDYQSRKSLGNCNSFGFGIDTALAAAAAPIFPFSRGRGAHFPIFRHFEVCSYQPCITSLKSQ